MKIELSRTELQDVIGTALKSYIGELAGGKKITNIEFKSYPAEHAIITLDRMDEDNG